MHRHLLLLVLLRALVASAARYDELWQRAMALYDRQQWTAAADALHALATHQTNASVEAALGTSYHLSDRVALARVHYERALALDPDHADTLANLGFLFVDHGEYGRAIPYLERARSLLAPDRAARILHPLAVAYHYQRDYRTAEALYRQVPVSGHTAQYHYDRAVTLERLGNILDANHAYNAALMLDQDFYSAWLNIAALHQKYGNPADSIRNYARVLRIPTAPRDVRLMATTNLAIAFEMTDDVRSALFYFDRARLLLDDEPLDTHVALRVHVARAKRSACAWDAFDHEQDVLQHAVEHAQLGAGGLPGLMPFDTLLVTMDPRLRLAIARAHATDQAVATAAMFASYAFSNASPLPYERLVVGYASYDLNDHPTAHLLEGVFATHDRATIDAVAYNYGKDDGSAFRHRLVALVDEFVNLAAVGNDDCVRTMRARGLDIFMDAQGHTRGGRPHITAARPAPVVVNYLVYPGTSGASFVDYIVTDRLVTPPDAMATHFSEKLALLPYSYQVNYYPEAVVPHGRASLWAEQREEAGAFSGFTFINFNKIDKLEPLVFALWMAILRRVPQSRLLLLNPVKSEHAKAASTGDEIVRNLALEAAAHGIAPSRIAFVPRVPKHEHLRRHCDGRLFLDTLVYGAHSTATDALYAGLPVLTLAGDAFASRVGVSLLHNVNLPELVTHSSKEFEDLAVHIALEPNALLTPLQQRLRTPNDQLTRLFRTRDHVASLEAAQRVMATLQRRPNGTTAHIIIV